MSKNTLAPIQFLYFEKMKKSIFLISVFALFSCSGDEYINTNQYLGN